MTVESSGMMCCCLKRLHGFATDNMLNMKEPFTVAAHEKAEAELKKLSSKYYYLATVNTEQKQAKAMLERHGFVVLSVMKSNDTGDPVYLMSKDLKPFITPRKTRGSLLRKVLHR